MTWPFEATPLGSEAARSLWLTLGIITSFALLSLKPGLLEVSPWSALLLLQSLLLSNPSLAFCCFKLVHQLETFLQRGATL